MSLTFELRGQTSGSWPLTTRCIEQIVQIGTADGGDSADLLFGHKSTQDGVARHVSRLNLLNATESLIPIAKRLSPGFELFFSAFSNGLPRTGARMMSAIINGKNHVFKCEQDYWTLQTAEEMLGGIPAERRNEPAEIQTEGMGTVTISRQKAGTAEVLKLLLKIHKHLKNDSGEELAVVWG